MKNSSRRSSRSQNNIKWRRGQHINSHRRKRRQQQFPETLRKWIRLTLKKTKAKCLIWQNEVHRLWWISTLAQLSWNSTPPINSKLIVEARKNLLDSYLNSGISPAESHTYTALRTRRKTSQLQLEYSKLRPWSLPKRRWRTENGIEVQILDKSLTERTCQKPRLAFSAKSCSGMRMKIRMRMRIKNNYKRATNPMMSDWCWNLKKEERSSSFTPRSKSIYQIQNMKETILKRWRLELMSKWIEQSLSVGSPQCKKCWIPCLKSWSL